MVSIHSHENSGSTQKQTAKVGRSGGCNTDQGAVGNCTSVVAVIRSQTQNNEESTTESWFLDPLDTSFLKPSLVLAEKGQ